MRLKPVRLPEKFVNSIMKMLGRYEKKDLLERSLKLKNVLNCRKRPLEKQDLRQQLQLWKEAISWQMVGNMDNVAPEDKVEVEDKIHRAVIKKVRQQSYNFKPIKYDTKIASAFVADKGLSNYATTFRVLKEIQSRQPEFQPATVFDFGSGIGTTSWAVNTLWPDNIREYFCVDVSQQMNDFAFAILHGGNCETTKPIPGVYFRQFIPLSGKNSYDLVVSAYSLSELPTLNDRITTLRLLWQKAKQYLVLIENGSLEGYKTLIEARDFILEGDKKTRKQNPATNAPYGHQSGYVFAPCSHDQPCPRFSDGSNTPCNFEQDYYTLPIHKKNVSTERFSYMVFRKGARSEEEISYPRIVRPVLRRSKHVICRLCCANGSLSEAILTKSKHPKDLYQAARKSQWGDLLHVLTTEADQRAITDEDDPESTDEDESREHTDEHMVPSTDAASSSEPPVSSNSNTL